MIGTSIFFCITAPSADQKNTHLRTYHVIKARTLSNAFVFKREFGMFCQLENKSILLVSSTRIMIVFEFRKIRQCLARTKNSMIRFYIMQIAKFLQQLGYIIFEPIFISIEQNLVFV